MRYLFLVVFFVSSAIHAQVTNKVTYGVKLSFTIADIDARVKKMKFKPNQMVIKSLKDMVRNGSEIEAELLFSNVEANYKTLENLENEGDRKDYVLKQGAGGNEFYYTSLATQKSSREDCSVLEKCFVIENVKPIWELTQETKKIGNYVCHKAIMTNSKSKKGPTIAWYTNDIPSSFGPKNYYGLPGLILELKNPQVIFVAKKIQLNLKNAEAIKAPEGKLVTEKQYKALLKKSFPEFYKYKKKN